MRIIKLLHDIFIKKGDLGLVGVFIIILMYIVQNLKAVHHRIFLTRKLVTRYK